MGQSRSYPLFALAFVVAVGPSAIAATKKVKPKPAKNFTAGHGQLSGGNGEFGVVYSFQSHWNEEILSARYSVDPYVCYGYLYPTAGKKLLVLDIAIKNAQDVAEWFGGGASITAFDQHGAKYDISSFQQESIGDKEFGPTLNPGQGLGQPALHDAVRAAGMVDGDAQIEKIIFNDGRLDRPGETVLRFYASTATKARDGDAGDPKNVIAPLPDSVRDTSDASGATTLEPGNGGKPGDGVACPSNVFIYTLDSLGDAPADFKYKNDPGDGNKYVLATMHVKNAAAKPWSAYDGIGGAIITLKDADGDKFERTDNLKKSNADSAEFEDLDPGAVVTVRFLFEIPKNESIDTLSATASGGRTWAWKAGS